MHLLWMFNCRQFIKILSNCALCGLEHSVSRGSATVKRILALTAATVVLAASATANATNINFSSLPNDTSISSVSVDGFNFNNNGSNMYAYSGNPNDANQALIFSGSGGSNVEVDEGGAPFTLNDLVMTISWYDGNATDTVDVIGNILGGGTDSTTLTLGQGLQVYDLNWADLTSFTISDLASSSGYWALDNLDVNGVSPVPEPGTWLLMGTGLLGLALFALRRKSSTRRLTAGNHA
jgi:hypothetical protein